MRIKIKNQIRKNIYYEKNRDRLLQKQKARYTNYKELLKCYAESEKKLKA